MSSGEKRYKLGIDQCNKKVQILHLLVVEKFPKSPIPKIFVD
jgi:hypothetical protein